MGDDLISQLSHPDPDLFVVEGRWCVEALLDSDRFDVVAVVRSEGSHEDFDAGLRDRSKIYSLPKREMSEILGFPFHRGILALAKRPALAPLPADELHGMLVACPELADASNLGAIVRSAAALGARGFLVPRRRGADVFSRKAIRSSSGAVFRLPVYECADLPDDVAKLKASGFTVIGTSRGKDSIPLDEVPKHSDRLVLFGPEQGGLSGSWIQVCDVTIEIPMANGVDSLNVAACAAIVLYQLKFGNRN